MWVQWVFSVACLATVGYFAVALIARRGEFRAGRPTGAAYELSHLVANRAMLLMLVMPHDHGSAGVMFGLMS